MKVAIDISLYPLDRQFIPPIADVIERLNRHEGLEVWTNAMSTQIVGEFEDVWRVLGAEISTTFAEIPKGVFVMKVLNNPGEA